MVIKKCWSFREKGTWRRELGGGNLEEGTWRRELGGGNLEVGTWRWELGGGNLEVDGGYLNFSCLVLIKLPSIAEICRHFAIISFAVSASMIPIASAM